jgi:hypothetical protein
MNTQMRQTGTVEVKEILIASDLYHRHLDHGTVSWFIAAEVSWDWVGAEKEAELEAEWQNLVNPAPAPLTYDEKQEMEQEEREMQQDALCEQMASRDYEYSVYGD